MADVFSKEQRSALMSRVRSRGNAATELRLIAIFREFGISGWRRKVQVIGHPDFVFRAVKLAVFVDGCFWHGCPVHGSVPSSNSEFWLAKLERNRRRDRLVNMSLRRQGWRVVRLWQHELRDSARVAHRMTKLLEDPRR